MDELLGISDFSARCGLSIKMLRTYAARGLLTPAAVDASSGYRFYAAGQLADARLIALLRQAAIPLAEIDAFLADRDPTQLDRWASRIDREWSARRAALDDAGRVVVQGTARSAGPTPIEKGDAMVSTLSAAGTTHVGGRERNEDAVLVTDRLFGVADGLGGLECGDVASRLALEHLAAQFGQTPTADGLLEGARSANHAVWQFAVEQEAPVGTTLAVVGVTEGDAAVVVHAGDSRLYRFRDRHLEQLTSDHTVTADLVRSGEVDPGEAATHPQRHILTRALGVGPEIEVDRAAVECIAGDRLLLCTDGLFGALDDAALVRLLAGGGDPQAAADELVSTAVGSGVDDNVTAVVVDVR